MIWNSQKQSTNNYTPVERKLSLLAKAWCTSCKEMKASFHIALYDLDYPYPSYATTDQWQDRNTLRWVGISCSGFHLRVFHSGNSRRVSMTDLLCKILFYLHLWPTGQMVAPSLSLYKKVLLNTSFHKLGSFSVTPTTASCVNRSNHQDSVPLRITIDQLSSSNTRLTDSQGLTMPLKAVLGISWEI